MDAGQRKRAQLAEDYLRGLVAKGVDVAHHLHDAAQSHAEDATSSRRDGDAKP